MKKILLIKFTTPEGLERIRVIYDYPDDFIDNDVENIKVKLAKASYVMTFAISDRVFSISDYPQQPDMTFVEYIQELADAPITTASANITPRTLAIIADALWAFSNYYKYPEIFSLNYDSITDVVFVDEEDLKIDDGNVYVKGDIIGTLEGW